MACVQHFAVTSIKYLETRLALFTYICDRLQKKSSARAGVRDGRSSVQGCAPAVEEGSGETKARVFHARFHKDKLDRTQNRSIIETFGFAGTVIALKELFAGIFPIEKRGGAIPFRRRVFSRECQRARKVAFVREETLDEMICT
ncbi:MAG: hypothetical protein ACYCQJ_00025 [Nitrososphaerales archaeon]